MFYVFLCLMFLRIVSIFLSIKNKLYNVGYFLIGNILFDVIGQIVKSFNHYPKPYTGIGFLLFAITTFCYLSNGAWMMFCAGRSIDNNIEDLSKSSHKSSYKTLKQVAPLSLLSVFAFCMLSYPAIAGGLMLAIFYAYYGTVLFISLIMLSSRFSKITLSQSLLVMLSLGGIAQIILVSFLPGTYWLVNLSNSIFYLTVSGASLLAERFDRLLKR